MDARFSGAHSIIMQGIRSTMTLPLLHAGDLLGIMHLDSLFTSNAFTEKDLQICTGMAAQAAISIQNARLATRIEKEAQTRAQISRLIPPSVVEQVIKGELTIEKGGRLSEVTMLFSDIRGFTTMSDGRPRRRSSTRLNEYFEVMVDILFKYTGTLDKFVGDEIIGLFGAPIAIDDAPFKAVSCAIAMLQALEEFNRTRAAENQSRDPDRHRHQHRQRDHRVDRLDARAPVHRDRRRDERRVAPRQRRRAPARSSSPRTRTGTSPAASKRPRCRP